MQITETTHYLEQPMHGIFTACYAILGKEITLVDSGLPGTWESIILPYLKQVRRDPKDISLIVHTHNHGDHVGSDQAIKAATGAEIAVHESGAEALEKPEMQRTKYLADYGKYLTEKDKENILKRPLSQPLKVDRTLKDGEALELGPISLEVMHSPGHSPDSVCFYDKQGETIFTGDSVVGRSTRTDDFIILQDVDAYLNSIDRLMKMSLRLMLMDHPYLPYERAILKGFRLREYLKFSSDINLKIADQIVVILKKAKRPMSAAEVSYAVCPVFRRKIPEGVTNRTVLVHLQRLAKQGVTMEVEGPARILWALKA